MLKKLLLSAFVLTLAMAAHIYARNVGDKGKREQEKLLRLETTVRELPDSVFNSVEMEDLLNDEVYLKLAHEGWSPEEIVTIMNTAVADKKAAKKKFGYGFYAKQWLPAYGRQPGGDTLYQFIDTLFNLKMQASVARTVPTDLLNKTWPEIPYNPEDRKKGLRNPGYFRPAKPDPSCGRMHWAALHPEDPDRLYAVADGCGIFKTDDCGKHWTCITDNIPVRADRSTAGGYAIPVDPDDWDHVFAFMNNASVYESVDGGDSWRRIVGATHKGFKRGDCFRDAEGNLKFIGAQRPGAGWASKLWISEDTCKTWTEVIVPDSLKDINPQDGRPGLWFQYITFDPNDRNRIYLPTSRSILYFDDGAKSEIVNGRRVYNIKKMHFKVYDQDGKTRRFPSYGNDDPANDAIFPCPAQSVGDLVVNPNNPNQMWFATGSQITNRSAVYRSEDRGRSWITLSDPSFNIGGGNVFGNEMASVWLGGFGVNFADTTRVYGCSMSSAVSYDGGRHFYNFNWANALASQHTDGNYYTVSASRHNADNHFIRSHKSGRVFRGSDGGMLMVDDNVRANKDGTGIWTQIGGNMGQMLFYHIAVNEFGDQVMAGNTQDIDGQTYRYGRWGRWRGYEGSESFINPYTGAVYFSGSMGNLGWDGDYVGLSSWRCATTRADVVSGSWFMSRSGVTNERSFSRCDDLGQRLVSLYDAVGEIVGLNRFALARDKGRTTVFVCTAKSYYKISTDCGNTFQPILYNGEPLRFINSVPAADPDNSDILYIGIGGSGNNAAKVIRYYVNEQRYEEVGTGLPAIPCTQLFFHEGSGDLYFFHSGSAGFYILERNDDGTYASNWRYWTKGYNSGKCGNAEINYTTQEMVICDYGRGVWVADLEHPADRYFRNGFALKELSFKDGRRTIGIDTQWKIPLYYNFKWTVNGVDVDNPYQYLRRSLEPGDRVQLTLTLRESPDVSTVSSVYVIPEPGNPDNLQATPALLAEGETPGESVIPNPVDNTVVKEPGRAIYSNGRGRVDLGYHDYFFKDFTIDLWVKPMSDGTILANRCIYGDNKGWLLAVENGTLKFQYAPAHTFLKPNYEPNFTQVYDVTGGGVEYNSWHHVAVTHERYGNICLYLDGKKVAEQPRGGQDHTLNNAVVLSLFGDAIERNTIEAALDELKIWSKALTQDEVRREMYSTNPDKEDGLVAYYPFNGGSLENDLEMFTRRHIQSRVRAEVQHPMMNVPTCARRVSYGPMTESSKIYSSAETPLIGLSLAQASSEEDTSEGDNSGAVSTPVNIGVYAYEAAQWQNEEDNLDLDYFDWHSVGYLISPFDALPVGENGSPRAYDIDFYPVEEEFNPKKTYRVYAQNPNVDTPEWECAGNPVYDTRTGALRLSAASLEELAGKKLLIVSLKPSIELVIPDLADDGVLDIYDEAKATYKISANILEGLPEPSGIYQIESDGILLPSGLYFANGHADGEMRLDLGKLGPFNSSVSTTLRSADNPVKVDSLGHTRASMIPMTINVRNRIMPRNLGNAVKMLHGCMDVGNTANYQSLRGSNTVSMMGWVRVDSAKILTGTHQLLTFRDAAGVTTLQLVNGKLSFIWSQALTWNTNYAVTENDLGKWFHIAAVVAPDGVDLYFNGMKTHYARAIGGMNKGVGKLSLGKSYSDDTWTAYNIFCGAFDQVGVWNRSLSQEEVIRYMYEAVRLDDPKLLSYLNMDYFDENGVMRDCYHLGEVKPIENNYYPGESVTFNEPSIIPFDAKAYSDMSAGDAAISLTFPEGKARTATVTTFRGAPSCYINHDFQEYSALNKEFYAITYHTPLTAAPTDDETVTLTYRHRTIMGDENLAVAMRRTGTQEHLAGFIPAISVSEGTAVFEVPARFLSEASEIMFFTAPSSVPGGERPAYIQISFAGGISNGSELMLQEGENTIGINADIIGGNISNDVRVVINEPYAKADIEKINATATECHFNIVIDREKIDKNGLNPLTINLEGAKSNELKLNFYLEPFVRLSLKNGEESEIITPGTTIPEDTDEDSPSSASRMNIFRATSPITTLEVEAELVEGYLTEEVKLEVLTGLNNAMNMAQGNLLRNEPVTLSNLEHYASNGEGTIVEGWNLIGNPYLTNINLTKSQNVEFNPDRITKFLYQCDPVTANYSVFDMTDYDAEQQIHPFQAYFVQTMSENARFTVTPVAREEAPSKRTMAYTALENREVTLDLYRDGVKYDRVVVRLDDDATADFLTNEDAPKLWNLEGSSPEIYAMTADGKEAAVNVSGSQEVTLGVKAPESGSLSLRLASLKGLDQGYVVKLHDNVANKDWNLLNGTDTYNFTVPDAEKNDSRFTLTMRQISVGTGKVSTSGYHIYTDNLSCTVTGLGGDAMVSIYTPSGMNIFRTHTPEPELHVSLQSGIYVVVIRENGKDYSTKILVK